jgi:hypothetical protein
MAPGCRTTSLPYPVVVPPIADVAAADALTVSAAVVAAQTRVVDLFAMTGRDRDGGAH